MLLLFIFFVQILFLFVLSRVFIMNLGRFVARVTRSRKMTVYFLSFLFLPGTFVHELSHFLMASILLVRSGKLSLWPEIHDDGVKLGSLEIERTDSFRKTLIAISPVLVGSAIIFVTLLYSESTLLSGYIVFEIANTMFSSKKDFEGTLSFLVFFVSLLIVSFVLGVRIDFDLTQVSPLVERANSLLLIPIILDLVLVIFLRLL